MTWNIKCLDSSCGKETWAANIVDLISAHADDRGWLRCSCGNRGYVEKAFDLQEPGERWTPFLKGVVRIADANATYQPFAFLVSDGRDDTVRDLWFSYYKDLRPTGRLKLGHGPGGPPVVSTQELLQLLKRLIGNGVITRQEVQQALEVQ